MITRKHTIVIRLNDKEYQNLQKQVMVIRLPREIIIRKLILGLEIIPLPCEHHADLLRKLAGVCNNINQMVRLANTFDAVSKAQLQGLEDNSQPMTKDDYLLKRNDSDLPMTPSTFTWRFKLILKCNALPQNLNVHSLRHINVSMMIANGADVVTAAGLLGHAQPSTTLDIYSHAFDKNKKKAHQALQAELDL